ncbi:hypothetical protein NC653_018600 [Populus alba x Populus x berolinensis]|uniref:Uncharacterized protein n=1 Tax=Populus alba x Populus x berolinensis TaxID=444605 RepID=A0AAD6QGU7_9ROSI|nr:hypothetical protein NC653_018600 [Populus alba x Populus x berolinensis]
MSGREDSESDAPEEFTAEQGIQQDEEIRRVQKESKARVVREAKEKRRRLAQRKTVQPPKVNESVRDVVEAKTEIETETEKESLDSGGMLPSDIVQLLAAREKKVFLSDSEDENAEEKRLPKKKKCRSLGKETVILKEMAPPQCIQNSLEFLKKKKMQLSRSSSVLDNPNQALRLISASGLFSKK